MAVWNVIDHQELSGNATSWEKTSISSSYEHLYCVISARTDKSAVYNQMEMQLSGDTGNNYAWVSFQAFTGSAPTSGYSGGSLQDTINAFYAASANALADTFSTTEILIPNYANTTGQKQVFIKGGVPNSSTTNYEWMVYMIGGNWLDTSAVDEIKIFLDGGENFVQYSTFTLYGINGA